MLSKLKHSVLDAVEEPCSPYPADHFHSRFQHSDKRLKKIFKSSYNNFPSLSFSSPSPPVPSPSSPHPFPPRSFPSLSFSSWGNHLNFLYQCGEVGNSLFLLSTYLETAYKIICMVCNHGRSSFGQVIVPLCSWDFI